MNFFRDKPLVKFTDKLTKPPAHPVGKWEMMPNGSQKMELYIKGKLGDFVSLATTLMYKWDNIDEPIEFLPNGEPSNTFNEVIFFGPGMRQKGIGGRIIAEVDLGGRTLLTVNVYPSDWSMTLNLTEKKR